MSRHKPTIGIALGGGGVRGLAHLSLLQVFDDMNVKPDMIAGTSMGAIIGSLYAAGAPASSIRQELLKHLITSDDDIRSIFEKRKDLLKWFETFRLEPGSGIRIDRLLTFLFDMIGKSTFEELVIPLTVVAADFWTGDEVHFSSGYLLPAVAGSMAVPGVFAPVRHGDRLLIDGGVVNQVPWDIVINQCDIVVAIDVSGQRHPVNHKVPINPVETVGSAFDILQDSLIHERMKYNPPTIYIRPNLENIGLLEFKEFETVLQAGDDSREHLKTLLTEEIHNFETRQKRFWKLNSP